MRVTEKKVERIGTEFDRIYILSKKVNTLANYSQYLKTKVSNLWGAVAILTSLLLFNIGFSINLASQLAKIGF